MFKITEKDMEKESSELPTLPFVTKLGSSFNLYFQDSSSMKITYIILDGNAFTSINKYESIQDAVKHFHRQETIVDAELIIKRR